MKRFSTFGILISLMALTLACLLLIDRVERLAVIKGILAGLLIANLTAMCVIWMIALEVDDQRKEKGYTENDYLIWLLKKQKQKSKGQALKRQKQKEQLALEKRIKKTGLVLSK